MIKDAQSRMRVGCGAIAKETNEEDFDGQTMYSKTVVENIK